jgi:hypothetical protein
MHSGELAGIVCAVKYGIIERLGAREIELMLAMGQRQASLYRGYLARHEIDWGVKLACYKKAGCLCCYTVDYLSGDIGLGRRQANVGQMIRVDDFLYLPAKPCFSINMPRFLTLPDLQVALFIYVYCIVCHYINPFVMYFNCASCFSPNFRRLSDSFLPFREVGIIYQSNTLYLMQGDLGASEPSVWRSANEYPIAFRQIAG